MKKNDLYSLYSSLLLLLFINILFSCNKSPKNEMLPENKLLFNKSISTDLSLFDAKNLKKEIIKLSYADSIMIPAYSNLLITGNNIILYSQKTFQIFRFDTNGNFVNFIGKRGNGPGEFTEMRDVIIKSKNENIIEILDYESIIDYQLDGRFIKKTKIKYPAFSFAYDSINYWFYTGNNPSFSQYKLVQSDTCFQQKNEYFKISKNSVPLVENNFWKGNYATTFRESLSPYVYILNNEIKCSYYIDFGRFEIPDAILASESTLMIEELGKIEYATIRGYMESENYTFLSIMKYTPQTMFPDLYYWIIDKKTKKEKLIRIKDFAEDSYLLYPQTITNDDLIYFIGYDIESVSVDEAINLNSNPSIIKMNIKDLFEYEK